jgi:adenine-specific DNA-methyltransferase
VPNGPPLEGGHARPESALLHDLVTHRVASRWKARSPSDGEARTVLYPHVTEFGKRVAVDLSAYPGARAYLETHRDRLEGRTYVKTSGRHWFEIWVPQQPADWAKPKIVWPDIADRPRFFLDESGAIVNGDCYWLPVDGLAPEEISLILAVANSTFALRFYDASSGNRLYSGRRRFITQYVKELPLPECSPALYAQIHRAVRKLQEPNAQNASVELEEEVDALVWSAFGLSEEIRRQP